MPCFEALTVTTVLTDRLDLDVFINKHLHIEYSIGIFAAIVFYRIFCIGKIHTICCNILLSIQQIIHLDCGGYFCMEFYSIFTSL